MFVQADRRVEASGLILTLIAAAVLAVIILLAPLTHANAQTLRGSQDTGAPNARSDGLRGTVLGFAKPRLGHVDQIATLTALQTALTEVGDGASYVWHREHGKLSGVNQPVASVLDDGGRVCRTLRVTLSAGIMVRTLIGKACRNSDGRWSLEG